MRHLLKVIACSSLFFCMPNFGDAQDNTPRTLAPRTLSPIGQHEPAPTSDPVPVKTISGGINVQSLDSVSSEALGVLSGKDAFPSDMWAGVDRRLVEHLINDLPATPISPYLRILQRRLLLSAAQPPQGKSGEQSLLALRASKLAEMGQTSDVIALINSAPQSDRTPDLAILETEAQLVNREISRACTLTATNMQSSTDKFWIKSMAFCRMMAKQNDQAMLSLSLLKDLGDNDPVYYQLMDALASGEKVTLDSLPAPKALDIALIEASKARLSGAALETNNPNLLGLLVKGKSVGAVDKAAQLNLVNIASLQQAYLSVKFKAELLNDALTAAETLDPMQAQALLYQVSAKEGQLPVIQTEAMGLALQMAKETDTFFTISRLYGKMIANLSRGIDHLWFAPQAMRALLAAGDWDNAKAWYLVLRNAAFTDQQAAKAWTAVRPLAAFAGFDISHEAVSQTLTNWWAAQEESPQSFEMANLILSMSDGLGMNVPDKLWITLMEGPKNSKGATPKPGIWIKMNKAALSGRVGETLLTALIGLNHASLEKMDVTYLRDVLFGLRAISLERDARIIAVETALQAGL